MQTADSLEKTLMGERLKAKEGGGVTNDEMVRWHHQLNGHEFEQTPGDSGRQRILAVLWSMGLGRVTHSLATEQQQQATIETETIQISGY